MRSSTPGTLVSTPAPEVIPDTISRPVSDQPPVSVPYEEAKQAAEVVRAGAGSAPFENRLDDPAALELAGRSGTAMVRDDLDAERWLDEGGSFSSEAVTRWPARR
jgi:hypothetical protein